MNKTNGVREKASASTSLYCKELSISTNQRQSSSGFPSFLKWFKRNERENRKANQNLNGTVPSVSQRYLKDYGNHLNGKYNSSETLSPPSSPILGYVSPSSSCDSVLSTSTTGFAFIPPNNYQPFQNNIPLNNSIIFEPDTDTYRDRLKKQKHLSEQDKKLDLTLRKKYHLYDSDTLKSNDILLNVYDNIQYIDRSLPHIKHKTQNENSEKIGKRKHRRTASDSSKDKKCGIYVHVKGKRRAPPPPPLTNGIADKDEGLYEIYDQENYKTLPGTSTISSTLSRKKRRAPPPPAISPSIENSPKSILSDGLFDDKDIKAIIEGTSNFQSNSATDKSKDIKMKESRSTSKDREETNAARRLTEQQKQILIDNIVKSQVPSNVTKRMSQIISSPLQSPTSESDTNELDLKISTPVSPISPRPWYKRPISSHRDSSIPFKREIVLKTMEKRKSKYKEKDTKSSNIFPDVGHSRSSIFDAGHKFGFFSRNKDPEEKAKDKEKRRSGIGIPNISELDREAAEIVNREHANCRAKQQAENEKFFNPPEHLILQQQMFGSKGNVECSEELDETSSKITSTKDLISKFEATSNTSRITLNTSFIGRIENFVDSKNQGKKSENDAEETELENKNILETLSEKTSPQSGLNLSSNIFNNMTSNQSLKLNDLTEIPDNKDSEQIKAEPSNSKIDNSNNITKITWTCPFCTLVNPNWRIICEVCERIKPYDKNINITKESKQENQTKEQKLNDEAIKQEPVISTDMSTQEASNADANVKKSEPMTEWEKKAERVMKYFKPRTSGNALSKSSSETTVNKKQAYFRKSASPSKLPISTPKLDMQFKQPKTDQSDIVKSQNLFIPKIPEEKESNLPSPTGDVKKELLDSSVIVTTVTPVFYAQTAFAKKSEPKKNISKSQEAINIDEVRNVRLARFSKKLPALPTEAISRESLLADDHDSLEREKKRLREMIRAMNAKALAEKYPIIKNSTSTNELVPKIENVQKVEQKPSDIQEVNKLGAIKKVFAKTPTADNLQTSLVSIPNAIPTVPDVTTNQITTSQISKPIKVSSSAQTTGVVKVPEAEMKYSPESNSKKSNNTYASILKPSNIGDRKIHEKNIFLGNDNSNINKYTKFSDYDNFKVQEISQQLKSVKGINDFKETLKNPLREMSRTDTLALNKIMRNLELAISEGQDELAAQIAIDLAKMKVSLHVTKQRNDPPSNNDNNPNKSMIVDICVEDKVSKKGPIQITVMPALTVVELKQKMFMDFGIPVELQKWSINNELVSEESRTLLQLGVKDSLAKLKLYLSDSPNKHVEEKQTNLEIPPTSIAVQEDIDDDLSSNGSSNSHNDIIDQEESSGAVALPLVLPNKNDFSSNDDGWVCPLCTLINLPYRTDCIACCEKRPLSYKAKEQPINKLNNFVIPDELKRFLAGEAVQYKPDETKNDLNKINPNRKSSEIFNIIVPTEPKLSVPTKTITIAAIPMKVIDKTKGSQIIVNSNISKIKYRGVDNYNPNRKSKPASTNVGTTGRRYNKKHPAPPIPKQTTNHYLELLSLDNTDYVPNVEPFECPICFMEFETGEGVILRDCLHTFCKECLQNTVQYSDEAEVRCPYMDTDYSCESVLQEREIKSLVTRDIYELHLAKSVRVAEHKIENTFHCKTPNCRGWCIYEDNVNQFKCPVCKITNCLTCRVIHDGLSCKQYQDRLNSDCDSNIDARRTKEMLKDMVEKGEAMNCPTCQVVMMKKWGCDWLKCSMCKTEICWVTRGPRWGPAGKGDTTAGCKCGVDGKKCHPKCNYCH